MCSRCSPRRASAIAANIAAIEAQRDFWLASRDVDAALAGGGAAAGEDAARIPDPAIAGGSETGD